MLRSSESKSSGAAWGHRGLRRRCVIMCEGLRIGGAVGVVLAGDPSMWRSSPVVHAVVVVEPTRVSNCPGDDHMVHGDLLAEVMLWHRQASVSRCCIC